MVRGDVSLGAHTQIADDSDGSNSTGRTKRATHTLLLTTDDDNI
jgi:hypothetical protein